MGPMKRYQVFVSSTFEDLEPERAAIFRALMKGNFIPAGMEIWSAGTRTPLARIKEEIDRSDFYVVVVAGRYGSENDEGISYTELEYNYAKERGLSILAFIHKSPEDLPSKYVDTDANKVAKLQAFRNRLREHHTDHWSKAEDLGAFILAALHDDAAKSTAVGWVRSDGLASEAALSEIRYLNQELLRVQAAAEVMFSAADWAALEETHESSGSYEKKTLDDVHGYVSHGFLPWSVQMTWRQLFFTVARHIGLRHTLEDYVKTCVLIEMVLARGYVPFDPQMEFNRGEWELVSSKLESLGLIHRSSRDGSAALSLTAKGELLFRESTISGRLVL